MSRIITIIKQFGSLVECIKLPLAICGQESFPWGQRVDAPLCYMHPTRLSLPPGGPIEPAIQFAD